mmetsp:Transcript_30779/g.56962  ORF Transcript_30779/g.56962 Transcript_30779/m.56962 type:complete len:154 (+) Transcript_30779:128-589(+)
MPHNYLEGKESFNTSCTRPNPSPVKFGPYTNLSLMAKPYALHKAVFVTCANVNGVNIEPEFLVESTVLMVERGLAERTMNNADAKSPKADLTFTIDLWVNDRYVHKLMVMADRATTIFCVFFNWSPFTKGNTAVMYQIDAMHPGTLDNVTYGS